MRVHLTGFLSLLLSVLALGLLTPLGAATAYTLAALIALAVSGLGHIANRLRRGSERKDRLL